MLQLQPFSPFIRTRSVLLAVGILHILVCSVFSATNQFPSNSVTPSSQNGEDQFRLGRAYYRGEGVSQSYELAGVWYRKAADQGNLKAMNNLGIMFLEGQGTTKDESQAFSWFRKAAEHGDPRSCYLCGLLLCEGRGVPRNIDEGIIWMRKAADAGNSAALCHLGIDYLLGEDGVPKDPKAAIPLLRSAAEKGHPGAMGQLGIILKEGTVLPKDEAKGEELLIKAAELGDSASQFQYATELMDRDPVKAYPWASLALLGGNQMARPLQTECMKKMSPEQIAAADAEVRQIRKKNNPNPAGGM